jgi:hypothetical protein
MGSHNFAPVRALDRELVILAAKATGAGAANLTNISARCGVVSIVRTGAGLYTVNLDTRYQELRHLSYNVVDPTAPDDWTVNITTDLVANGNSFGIAVYKGGVAADLTTDEKLTLEIVLKNSSR